MEPSGPEHPSGAAPTAPAAATLLLAQAVVLAAPAPLRQLHIDPLNLSLRVSRSCAPIQSNSMQASILQPQLQQQQCRPQHQLQHQPSPAHARLLPLLHLSGRPAPRRGGASAVAAAAQQGEGGGEEEGQSRCGVSCVSTHGRAWARMDFTLCAGCAPA